jgi:HAD superfamily hydrolase (TIGR01509 family)
MQATQAKPQTPRFDAILFDCDGVLVDSEPITNGVLRDMLEELGWKLTAQECMQHFVGKSLVDEVAIIARHTGTTVSEDWLLSFRERRNAALMRSLQPVRNVQAAVAHLHAAYGGRIACASGADRHKVEIQLRKCGLIDFFEGRIFSGYEVPRSKPFPDVYLAAAAALGVDPQRCAVVEDTVTGATAGVAAGATVFGYSPPEAGHDAPGPLRAAGVQAIFADMADLPALLVA